MVLCVDKADTQQTLEHLKSQGEQAWIIGHVGPGDGAPGVTLEI